MEWHISHLLYLVSRWDNEWHWKSLFGFLFNASTYWTSGVWCNQGVPKIAHPLCVGIGALSTYVCETHKHASDKHCVDSRQYSHTAAVYGGVRHTLKRLHRRKRMAATRWWHCTHDNESFLSCFRIGMFQGQLKWLGTYHHGLNLEWVGFFS